MKIPVLTLKNQRIWLDSANSLVGTIVYVIELYEIMIFYGLFNDRNALLEEFS